VVRLGVATSHLQAMTYGFDADSVAFLACVDTAIELLAADSLVRHDRILPLACSPCDGGAFDLPAGDAGHSTTGSPAPAKTRAAPPSTRQIPEPVPRGMHFHDLTVALTGSNMIVVMCFRRPRNGRRALVFATTWLICLVTIQTTVPLPSFSCSYGMVQAGPSCPLCHGTEEPDQGVGPSLEAVPCCRADLIGSPEPVVPRLASTDRASGSVAPMILPVVLPHAGSAETVPLHGLLIATDSSPPVSSPLVLRL
jgi:hypothetical protein